jgi:hypothetical protein
MGVMAYIRSMRRCAIQFRVSLWKIILSGGLLIGAACGRAEEPAPAAVPPDAECRKLVLGVWQDHYRGKRTLTVREDGTATMLVELSGMKAALYASRLRFDMNWSITDGRLKKQTVGGDPPGKVKLILKLMGDQVNEPILELTKDRLLLLDGDGKQKYDWKRIPPAKAAAP